MTLDSASLQKSQKPDIPVLITKSGLRRELKSLIQSLTFQLLSNLLPPVSQISKSSLKMVLFQTKGNQVNPLKPKYKQSLPKRRLVNPWWQQSQRKRKCIANLSRISTPSNQFWIKQLFQQTLKCHITILRKKRVSRA